MVYWAIAGSGRVSGGAFGSIPRYLCCVLLERWLTGYGCLIMRRRRGGIMLCKCENASMI